MPGRRQRRLYLHLAVTIPTLLAVGLFVLPPASAWTPLPVVVDPLVRMPGPQPGQVVLDSPNGCLNCHADYDPVVEPGHNWQGSMMAQAARDFLFWSCLTVAGQDSIWAVGRPNGTDLCLRTCRNRSTWP